MQSDRAHGSAFLTGSSPLCFEFGRRTSEGPGRFLERTPGLLHARAHEGTLALPICPQRAALSSAACGEQGGKRGDLSALQLRALRAAGADLPVLRPRQPVLRRGVRADSPARVVVLRRAPLSRQLPWRVSPRRTPARLARAACKSDASGVPRPRRRGHSGVDLDHHDPGNSCRHRLRCRAAVRHGVRAGCALRPATLAG